MAQKDVLLDVLEKFTSPTINLTPKEAVDPDGRKLPPLTNLGMGYVFEELIRRFNEENNEEAGEHFTPREVINLVDALAADPACPGLNGKRVKLLQSSLTESDESAAPVIKKVHRGKTVGADPLHGLYAVTLDGKAAVVEYEADGNLRDTEQVPLLEEGGIEAFMRREVLPHVPDAWIDAGKTAIGYEISFTRYFYKP